MKVAFIVNTYPPRLGGLEQHLGHLTQGLAELGHEVVVLTISDRPGIRTDGRVEVRTGRSRLPIADVISFPALGSGRSIARYLQRRHVDVVSTHTRFFPMSYVGVQAAHAAGIPVVHTEHGSGFVANPSPLIAVGSRAVDLTMGRHVLHCADRVLAVSEEAARFAGRLGKRPVGLFHNAITPAVHADVVDRPGHLVFVGRIVPGKGWETFLDVVAWLRGLGLDVDGQMLGDGVDIERARQRVVALGLQEAVEVCGRVTPEEVRDSLAGATLVNPTVLSEGFQTTLLEALAERGRVVTYQVPGAELLRGEGFPVVVTEAKTPDALERSLADYLGAPPKLADRSLIDQWTWSARAREYAQILTDVVEGRRRRQTTRAEEDSRQRPPSG